MISCWRCLSRSRSICSDCRRSFCWQACRDALAQPPPAAPAPATGVRCKCCAGNNHNTREYSTYYTDKRHIYWFLCHWTIWIGVSASNYRHTRLKLAAAASKEQPVDSCSPIAIIWPCMLALDCKHTLWWKEVWNLRILGSNQDVVRAAWLMK